MDLDELRTFVAIVRLGGFSRAAQALHRSQPAISRRIELLERELKGPLFERLPGGAVLTDAGAALLPHAEAALAAAKDGADAVGAITGGEGGRIALAIVGTLANARLTASLAAFRARYPSVGLDLQTANSQGVADLVRRGEATLGLRYRVDAGAGLACRTVGYESLLVVSAPGHRLADGARHTTADLAGERWVAFPRPAGEPTVRVLDQRLLAAGLQDPEITPIDSLTAQKRLVEAGFGLALLAESGVEDELRSGALKVIDVPDLKSRITVSLIHRRNGWLSPAAHGLMAALDQHFGA